MLTNVLTGATCFSGSSGRHRRFNSIAVIAERPLAHTGVVFGLAGFTDWFRRSAVVRARLLRDRKGNVGAVGPTEKAGDRRPLSIHA